VTTGLDVHQIQIGSKVLYLLLLLTTWYEYFSFITWCMYR